MAGGRTGFQRVRFGDPLLESLQANVDDVFQQLEDPRRGLDVGPCARPATPTYQAGEDRAIVYTGSTGGKILLPKANLRGANRSQALRIANKSPGNLVIVASGGDTVAGAATLTIATGVAVLLWSDGAASWFRCT